jgi:hypothetical protein
MDSLVTAIFARQDQLITRRQALEHLSPEELRTLLGCTWRVVVPGVYASSIAALTARQRICAALLHAGADALLTDSSALVAYRVPYVPDDDRVRLLNPEGVQRVSRDFISIRRSFRLPEPIWVDGFPMVPPHRAVCEFVVRHPVERDGLAVAAAAVQRGITTVDQLLSEAYGGPARGRPRLLRVIRQLHAGVRSAPEADFRDLVLRTSGLPEPLWNPLIELPDGRLISPDALWVTAGLVHEVNGRDSHSFELAGEDKFEDMQRRADALVVAGVTALSNTPRRIRREGSDIGREVVACYQRLAGRGLPPGVRIIRRGPPGTPSDVSLLGHDGSSKLTLPTQCDIAG